MLPKIVRENLTPVILDPQDQALLDCMHNCTIEGSMVLPSGYTIDSPPEGRIWHVDNGKITQRDK